LRDFTQSFADSLLGWFEIGMTKSKKLNFAVGRKSEIGLKVTI
jgi:hypothetical protein